MAFITESDLFSLVVVHGDADVPDGTAGRLINVFDDCVVIESEPSDAYPEGREWVAGITSVSVVGDASAA